jgi:hypothetical protein
MVADEIRMRTFLPDSISKTSSHIDIKTISKWCSGAAREIIEVDGNNGKVRRIRS